MALWFGITYVSDGEVLDEQVHGPYADTESLEDAVNDKVSEATDYGDNVDAVPIRFELCTDDVPELVSSEEIGV